VDCESLSDRWFLLAVCLYRGVVFLVSFVPGVGRWIQRKADQRPCRRSQQIAQSAGDIKSSAGSDFHYSYWIRLSIVNNDQTILLIVSTKTETEAYFVDPSIDLFHR